MAWHLVRRGREAGKHVDRKITWLLEEGVPDSAKCIKCIELKKVLKRFLQFYCFFQRTLNILLAWAGWNGTELNSITTQQLFGFRIMEMRFPWQSSLTFSCHNPIKHPFFMRTSKYWLERFFGVQIDVTGAFCTKGC